MQTVFRRASLIVGLVAALSLPAPSAIAAPSAAVPAFAARGGIVRLIAPVGASAPFPSARVVRALPGGTEAIDVPAWRARDAYTELVRRYGPGSVRPDGVARLADQHIPNDHFWPDMWGANRIGMPVAWAVSLGSPDVVIAVLDTGVNAAADLTGAVLPGKNFLDGGTDVSDPEGHGTYVAEVAAGRVDNGSGGAGICPHCSILPVKVAGPEGAAWSSDMASGVVWAVDHGATVVNISYAGADASGGRGSEVDHAVAYARSAGVSVVAGAGNDGDDVKHYPANAPGVLSVAATDATDGLETWSTRGGWVDLAAPGEVPVVDAAGQGWTVWGTSIAAPMVSGALALITAAAPTSTMVEREAALTSTAVPVSPAGSIGGGRIDVPAALAALADKLAQPTPPVVGAPVIEITNPSHAVTYTRAASMDVTWTETLLSGEVVGTRTVTQESTPVVDSTCDGSSWAPAGDPATPEAPTIPSGPLEDGTCHRWRIHVVDHSGRAGDRLTGIVFEDRRKPTVRAVLPRHLTRTSASTVTFRWSVDDGPTGSGPMKTTIATDKGRPTAGGCAGWSRWGTQTYAFPDLITERQYEVFGPICVRIRVTVVDRAGNATTLTLPAYRHS